MSALDALIRAEIATDGPMSLEHYMALCLGHPEHGYYMARPAIGAAGDFTTAPEISQMFGEIVGAVLAHAWQAMGNPATGKSAALRLVELGPGRATLMLDILRTLKVVPALHDAIDIHLVETSPRLIAAQEYRLKEHGYAATWHKTIDTVPEGPTLLVANEFFDALPIRQRVMHGGNWCELMIGVSAEDTLEFIDGPAVPVGEIDKPLRMAEEGAILEDCPAARDIASKIGARLTRNPSVALIVDYGYREPAHGDSLQALAGKRPANPLENPGEADLTAHVDFTAIAKAATTTGAAAFGPITQGSFLTALGIGLRAERLRASGANARDLTLALERLTGVGGMGNLFKVLALTSPGMPAPAPFGAD